MTNMSVWKKGCKVMDKIESLISATKLNEFLKRQEKAEEKKDNLVCILAAVGVVLLIAAIAFAIYKYLNRDYFEDFDDDFEDEDEFDDDFFEEDFDC